MITNRMPTVVFQVSALFSYINDLYNRIFNKLLFLHIFIAMILFFFLLINPLGVIFSLNIVCKEFSLFTHFGFSWFTLFLLRFFALSGHKVKYKTVKDVVAFGALFFQVKTSSGIVANFVLYVMLRNEIRKLQNISLLLG